MTLGPGDMPEFVDQFLMLLYVIFNPIVFVILLGALFIYIVYRVIKHFKSFYYISLRFKLPKALVDGVLGLLLILLLYDFYGQILAIDGPDIRSEKVVSIVNHLINQSAKLDGEDNIFNIPASEWNNPACTEYINSNIYKQCKYINGIATEKHYFFQNIKYDCKMFEDATLKECANVNLAPYEDLGLINRLINHIGYPLAGEQLIRNDIPIEMRVEILNYPNIFSTIIHILSNPCKYIDRKVEDKYISLITQQEKILRCNKKDKDNIKLYLYKLDKNFYPISIIIKRED